MIDSKLINEDVEQEIEYPCLMINDSKDIVVIFTSPENGTVVYTNREYQPIGYDSKTWGMNHFEKYNGEVILSNK